MSANPDVILAAINESLASDTITRRLEKLDNTGCTEQHLFIQVRSDAWPWAPLYMLAGETEAVPTRPPTIPGHLDGLWLSHSMNRFVLCWTRHRSWPRVEVRPAL